MSTRAPRHVTALHQRPALNAVAFAVQCLLFSAAQAQTAPATPRAPLPVTCAQTACAGFPNAAGVSTPVNTFVARGAGNVSVNGNTMTVNQTSSTALFNWRSFDIASGNTVKFDQQAGRSAVAINRIHDTRTSRIDGNLSANGQVYLINPNGLLFGSGANVDVAGLIASTLDIDASRVENGLLGAQTTQAAFSRVNTPQASSAGVDIERGARIHAGVELKDANGVVTGTQAGSVYVFAPRVNNEGAITVTPGGQVVMAAGERIYLAGSESATLRGLLVEVGQGGVVTNRGDILTPRGNTTMVGMAVNQSGRINATSAINENGSIRLLAREVATATQLAEAIGGTLQPGAFLRARNTGRVEIGSGSSSVVALDAKDTGTAPLNDANVAAARSTISVEGRQVVVGGSSTTEQTVLQARGGDVVIQARSDLNVINAPAGSTLATLGRDSANTSLAIGSDVRIDVSGEREVQVDGNRNYVFIDRLTSNELRDAPLQRDGFLRGQGVHLNVAQDHAFIDVSNRRNAVAGTQAERNATGGLIALRSEGRVDVAQGASFDISGGSTRTSAASGRTSQLVTETGRVVDIANARADERYVGFADRYTANVDAPREGAVATRTFDAPVITSTPERLDGKTAGTLEINAPRGQMAGTVQGQVSPGPQQRSSLPAGGQVLVGNIANSSTPFDSQINYARPHVLLTSTPNDAAFQVPASQADNLITIDSAMLARGGITRLDVRSDGVVTVAPDSPLDMGPGPPGNLALRGAQVDVNSDLGARGGSITVENYVRPLPSGVEPLVPSSDAGRIRFGRGVALDASGLYTANVLGVTTSSSIVRNGGSIRIAGVDVDVADVASFNVDAGASVSATGVVSGGRAGALSISATGLATDVLDVPSTGQLNLGDNFAERVRGFGFSAGGSLSLTAPRACLGADCAQDGVTSFDLGLLDRGFEAFTFRGLDSLTVANNTVLAPVPRLYGFRADQPLPPSGAELAQALTPQAPLPGSAQRPTTFNLGATRGGASVRIGEGAVMDAGAGGAINVSAGQSIVQAGSLVARGGRVNLGLTTVPISDETQTTARFEQRAIHLVDGSRVDVSGVSLVQTSPDGRRSGTVLDGGSVGIDAIFGSFAMDPRASILADGARDSVDLRRGADLQRTEVASRGGALSVRAQNSLFMQGSVSAQAGSADVEGGRLSVNLQGLNSGQRSPGIAGSPPQELFDSTYRDDRVLSITEQASLLPRAGEPFTAAVYAGRGQIRPDLVNSAGFDTVQLTSSNTIAVAANTALATSRSLTLDSQALSLGAGATLSLAAPRLTLGALPSVDAFAPNLDAAPRGGSGSLLLQAQQVDLVGTFSLQGIGQTRVEAAGDVSLRGGRADSIRAQGQLHTVGSLHIDAAQLTPVSMSDFTFDLGAGEASRFVLGTSGQAPLEPLSAAGSVTLRAREVELNGRISAPHGRIAVQASEQLRLGDNARLSVAGTQDVLLGTLFNGNQWLYSDDPNRADANLASARGVQWPDKGIILDAPTLDASPQAQLDVSGGGRIVTHEFVAGPRGSVDWRQNTVPVSPGSSAVQANPYFALLPSRGDAAAPFDPQIYNGLTSNAAVHATAGGSNLLRPGQTITLGPGSGIPAGTYTVMPARYALLPGAFAVQAVSGYGDIAPGASVREPSGSVVVAGRLGVANDSGSQASTTRWSGYRVLSGEQFRRLAEWKDASADTLLDNAARATGAALPRTPVDAGVLQIDAQQQLRLSLDSVRAEPGRSGSGAQAVTGRGADIGLAAPNVVVSDQPVGDTGTVSDTLQLNAGQLSAMGAERLVLGARTSSGDTPGSVVLSTRADTVSVGGAQALTAGEVLLSANNRVSVAPGASIAATGGASHEPALQGTQRVSSSGDGAALLVGAADTLPVWSRSGAQGERGDLSIAPSARLSGRSIVFDASREQSLASTLEVAARNLGLSATRINLGEAPTDTRGLTLSNSVLAQLSQVEQLTLTSGNGFNVYGDVSLGSSALQRLALDGSGLVGASANASVSLQAGDVVLRNSSGAAAGSTAPTGSGELTIAAAASPNTAGNITLAGGDFQLAGFARNSLLAQSDASATGAARDNTGQIRFAGTGHLQAEGDLTLDAARITGARGATQRATATGVLSTLASSADAADTKGELGASLTFTGQRIDHGGRIVLPGGLIALNATGTAATDDVRLRDGSVLDASGSTQMFAEQRADASAGSVRLASAAGSVRADTGSRINLAGSGERGDAGSLQVQAAQGELVLEGQLATTPGTAAQGAAVQIDVGRLPSLGSLAETLNAADTSQASLRQLDVRVRRGDVTLEAGQTLSAQQIRLAADGGDSARPGDGRLRIDGTLNASGERAGRVELHARESVTLGAASRIDAASSDAGQEGGTVLLSGRIAPQPASTTLNAIVVEQGARVNVSGGTDAPGGVVTLRAPWQFAPSAQNQATQSNDVAIAALPTDYLIGARSEVVEATFVPVLTAAQSSLTLNPNAAASTTNPLPNWRGNLQNYMTRGNIERITDRLARDGNAQFDLRPGLEVRTTGNITLAGAWDFTAGANTGNFQWRYGGTTLASSEPGALTLRAGGNLILGADLTDGYVTTTTSTVTLPPFTAGGDNRTVTTNINTNAQLTPFAAGADSWRYQLTGGADLSGASAAATGSSGNLEVRPATGTTTRVVRTGTGRIDMAAAGDIEMQGTNVAVYTGGQRIEDAPAYENQTVRSFNPNFTTHGGGIRLEAGRDITFSNSPTQLVNNWLWRAGRATEVGAEDGSVSFDFSGASNAPTAWWVNAGTFRQGIGALGGGDVSIAAGRDVTSVTAAVPSNAYLDIETSSSPVLRELNAGDLTVQAGAAVSGGLFYAQRGELNLRANSVGPKSVVDPVFLAQGDNPARVQSRLDLELYGSFNPTLAPTIGLFSPSTGSSPMAAVFATYGENSEMLASSLAGEVALKPVPDGTRVPSGETPASGPLNLSSRNRSMLNVLPGSVELISFGNDVLIGGSSSMLWPKADGQLRLLADVDVSGSALTMGGIDPLDLTRPEVPRASAAWGQELRALYAGALDQQGVLDVAAGIFGLNRPQNHGRSVLHANNTTPAAVIARTGNIDGISISVPKALDMQAAGDIRNTTVFAQNVRNDDVSRVHAGGRMVDIEIDSTGPGVMEVLAGREIDLGQRNGIVSRGNLVNANLAPGGADLLIASGLGTTNQGFVQRAEPQNVLRQFVRYDAYAAAGAESATLNAATLRALGLSEADVAVLEQALVNREAALQSGSAFETWLQGLSPAQQTRLSLKLIEQVQATVNQRFVSNRNTETFAAGYALLNDLFPRLTASAEGLRQFVRDNPFKVADNADALRRDALQGLPAPLVQAIELGLAASPEAIDDPNSAFNLALAALPREQLDAGARQLLAQVQHVAGQATEALRADNRLDAGVLTPFARGLDAQARAFAPQGDVGANGINLVFSQIKTEQSGRMVLAAPRGSVVAGQANPPAGGVGKQEFQLGVLSLGGGSITGFVRDNFDVFRSRVFTVAGGDVHLWAGVGNIDAGSGARDVRVAPPPRLVIDGNTGIASLDISASVSGSGIGALKTREDQPISDIRLMAPNGFIDAGEAGIRADSGRITLGTNVVINAGNISAGGGVTGGAVVVAPPAPVPQASKTDQAEKAVEQAKKALEDQTREAEERAKKERRKRVTGEFIGFGEGP